MNRNTDIDVAIVGGGPAGLQAALVLARTRKRVVVFDGPESPRNAASHGVHNFVGLDGLLPSEIREQAWRQIDVYGCARLERQAVTAIGRDEASGDFLVTASEGRWRARHVVLACGYRDVYPAIEGFRESWGRSIIPCPFCDGYENRDRRWGIVASSAHELEMFPAMVQNWTADRVVIASRALEVSADQEAALARLGVPLYRGDIAAIRHEGGAISSVTLDGGETIEVGTLLWTPEEAPAPLVTNLVSELGLELTDDGYIAVDAEQRTNVPRLWAAGDVQGWMGAIESAGAGGMAAAMIVHDWYAPEVAAS